MQSNPYTQLPPQQQPVPYGYPSPYPPSYYPIQDNSKKKKIIIGVVVAAAAAIVVVVVVIILLVGKKSSTSESSGGGGGGGGGGSGSSSQDSGNPNYNPATYPQANTVYYVMGEISNTQLDNYWQSRDFLLRLSAADWCGDSKMRFKFELVNQTLGTFRIKNCYVADRYLTMSSNGTLLFDSKSTSNNNQLWQMYRLDVTSKSNSASTVGVFAFKNYGTKKILENSGSFTVNTSSTPTWDTSDTQRWSIHRSDCDQACA